MNKGFTLIEILLVMAIMGFMTAVTLPVSYRMYQSYKASLGAEDVLVYISKTRREAFLYGEEKTIEAKSGIMQDNGSPVVFQDAFVQIDTPIRFYKNGTTSGGALKIYVGDYAYLLRVQPVFGNLMLEKGT